ncbi:hypothetical protein DZF91_21000 [Actinomadura logoneensis]|uniref:Uncharacterized protein n=1 Tax=Actinomadura logoneensis TaxID=2293572 RepID=A0A372JIL7_9ACTN|nr:hypothetical protein DZF91_21000 [Actinomadura logoneensis]
MQAEGRDEGAHLVAVDGCRVADQRVQMAVALQGDQVGQGGAGAQLGRLAGGVGGLLVARDGAAVDEPETGGVGDRPLFVAIATRSPHRLDGLHAAGWTAAAVTVVGGLIALALTSPRPLSASASTEQAPSLERAAQ